MNKKCETVNICKKIITILSIYSCKCEMCQNYQTLHQNYYTNIKPEFCILQIFSLYAEISRNPHEWWSKTKAWYYNQLTELTRHIMQIQHTTILASWRLAFISVCSTFNRWTSVLRPTASSTASKQLKTRHAILNNLAINKTAISISQSLTAQLHSLVCDNWKQYANFLISFTCFLFCFDLHWNTEINCISGTGTAEFVEKNAVVLIKL